MLAKAVERERAAWVRVEEGCRACEGLHRWEELRPNWHHLAYLAEIYAHNSVSWFGLIVNLDAYCGGWCICTSFMVE